MRRVAGLIAAVGLAAVATTASAAVTNFVGDYNVALSTTEPGLTVNYTPLASDVNGLNFALDVGQDTDVNLFTLYTREGSINNDDWASEPIQVAFTFTLPEVFGGAVNGTTQGSGLPMFFGYILDTGTVSWLNGGTQILTFGDGGQLQVDLDDAVFSFGFTDLNQVVGSATVAANFKYLSAPTAAVPEPATWAMMLLGFFGLGSAVRSRRNGLRALAAAA